VATKERVRRVYKDFAVMVVPRRSLKTVACRIKIFNPSFLTLCNCILYKRNDITVLAIEYRIGLLYVVLVSKHKYVSSTQFKTAQHNHGKYFPRSALQSLVSGNNASTLKRPSIET
jgi:hypothetical protein